MSFRQYVLLLTSAFLFGCAAHKDLVREGRYPSGKLNYHIELDIGGRKQGHETWWYDNGAKKYEAVFDKNQRNGIFQAWYPEGTLWYRGFEDHGVAQDSLIFWYVTGKIQTVALFKDGVQVHYQAFDSATDKPVVDTMAMKRKQDSLQTLVRKQGIAEWSGRVQAAVEPYWILPKELVKSPYQSVALIRIGRNGDLQKVTWASKSSSSAFNALAVRAINKVKRFPAFPPGIPDATLEIQYEFVTPGKAPKRKKLELLDP